MSRITAPVGEVTTPITRGAKGRALLAAGVEQAFGGERLAAPVEQRHQRALPGQLEPLDDDLVARARRIGGEPAGGDHLDAVLGREAQLARLAAPDHRVDAGGIVLEGEIAMARAVPLEAGNLAAHPDMVEGALDGPLERRGKLGDAEGGRVVARDVRC